MEHIRSGNQSQMDQKRASDGQKEAKTGQIRPKSAVFGQKVIDLPDYTSGILTRNQAKRGVLRLNWG